VLMLLIRFQSPSSKYYRNKRVIDCGTKFGFTNWLFFKYKQTVLWLTDSLGKSIMICWVVLWILSIVIADINRVCRFKVLMTPDLCTSGSILTLNEISHNSFLISLC
jgi:hypothetical protein